MTYSSVNDAGHCPLSMLICKQDRKWKRDVRQRLSDAGIRVVQMPQVRAEAARYVAVAYV
jgi:hypothetical protein